MTVTLIDRFRGKYFFLSNFYAAPIERRGITYPTSEHAYQAAKTGDRQMKRKIAEATSPKQAKHFGYKVVMREDWEDVKLRVMKNIVRMKFKQNPDLSISLIGTYPAVLEEGNNHGDRFWGKVEGTGQNHLGRILTEVRKELMEHHQEITKRSFEVINEHKRQK